MWICSASLMRLMSRSLSLRQELSLCLSCRLCLFYRLCLCLHLWLVCCLSLPLPLLLSPPLTPLLSFAASASEFPSARAAGPSDTPSLMSSQPVALSPPVTLTHVSVSSDGGRDNLDII